MPPAVDAAVAAVAGNSVPLLQAPGAHAFEYIPSTRGSEIASMIS